MGEQEHQLERHQEKGLGQSLMILCDTDVFIEAFKGNSLATGLFRNIGFENISVSAITVMELYFGAINKREMMTIKNRLQQLMIIQVDQGICETAVDLVEEYAKSHGLQVPDALIAATAIGRQMKLLSYNVKDFKFIKGIHFYKPAG